MSDVGGVRGACALVFVIPFFCSFGFLVVLRLHRISLSLGAERKVVLMPALVNAHFIWYEISEMSINQSINQFNFPKDDMEVPATSRQLITVLGT